MNVSELARTYELDVYAKRNVTLVRGAGARLWDAAGREYIDCVAGFGVASIGHCNPQVVAAVSRQVERLVTCPGSFDNDVRARLCERLIGITPSSLSRVFLCNSGAEAIEAAIKLARLTTGRTDFVCATRGFHGRTFGAMSATHNPKYRQDFEPAVPGFSFVRFNDRQELEAAVTDRTAGVILEIVQGEGGVRVGRPEFFRGLDTWCAQRGVLLIIDEVQTGFCRTGRMFASLHYDLRPDILCLAKSIAGGLPMGAVLCSDAVPTLRGKHGSTFGGNPLCCAAGLAAIEFMQAERLDVQAAEKGAYLMNALRQCSLDSVREVRGLGLMVGIELRHRVQPVLVDLMKRGVLALPAGQTVLRLLPPLVITHAELDRVVEVLVCSLRR
ncbi:MAG: acetylornithine/succinylornithine family transaminase [Phycisphaerae bacterium]|jgi:acetylornithine/LysW-gamma-L-lysine aminotransferase